MDHPLGVMPLGRKEARLRFVLESAHARRDTVWPLSVIESA